MSADELKYVQEIPDHCDRIVWRKNYYHLPLEDAAATIQRLEAEIAEARKPVTDRKIEVLCNNLYGIYAQRGEHEGRIFRDSRDVILNLSCQLKAANAELTPLRAQFPHGPLHEHVAAVLGDAKRYAFLISGDYTMRLWDQLGEVSGDSWDDLIDDGILTGGEPQQAGAKSGESDHGT
jgi:hypothetical protein